MSSTVRRILPVLAVVAAWVAVSWLVLRRLLTPDEDLTRWDRDDVQLQRSAAAGPALAAVEQRLRTAHEGFADAANPRERLRHVRLWMDSLGEGVETDATIVPVEDGDVRGEWVLGPDHDPDRRLLYVHGGAFQSGSPLSHRALTTRLAERTGAAVFAVRYRLQPEHRRRDATRDVHDAWAWMVATGPTGPAPARTAFAAGDSAGGTLVLELVAHLRDTGGRQADAVVALSPLTDSTFHGRSCRTNRDSDAFLGPTIGRLLRLPRTALLAGLWATTGVRPDDPEVSPLLGELHDLPPTLVQASDDEMFRDDAVRYVTKAQAAGSPATVQLWPDVPHVFPAFLDLPQSDDALARIAAFLADAAPTVGGDLDVA